LETLHYKLQQFDPGIVWLDSNNIVTAVNGVAQDILGNLKNNPLGENIVQFHPEKSRSKIEMLLHKSQCPMSSPPPITMMINAIERLLMIKVSKMFGSNGEMGTCMVFYDFTGISSGGSVDLEENKKLAIKKLPVYKNNKIILVDLEKVIYIKAEGHYCSLFTEDNEYLCNLSISDLSTSLFLDDFKRVHRSYIVNLKEVGEIEKKEKDLSLKVNHHEQAIPVSRNYQSMVKEYFNLGRV
jgi:hypothetical protein